LIHYITTNGIEAPWIAIELEILERREVPWVLHSLRKPGQNFFGAAWAAGVNARTRVLYPLPRLRMAADVMAAPLRFRSRFASALANALFGRRESLRARVASIAHLLVATHWAAELRRRADREPIDLIHSQWIHSGGTVGMYGAWLLGVPFSFTGHAADLFRNRCALEDKIRRADTIVCISQFHRRFYLEHGGRPEQMLVVYCGIDSRMFPYQPREASGEPPRILSIGRLVEKKGFDVLIEACRILRDRGVEYRCEIAGNGPLEADLRRQVAAASLDDRVTLTGRPVLQEDLPGWLASGDLFAQPCVWSRDNDVDGTPRTLMEAMATGLPSVSTRLAGIPDIIEDGQSGLLVEPRDAQALADALGRLIADPALAKRMGREGRRQILETFDLSHCVDPLVERFRRYLPSGPSEPAHDSTRAGAGR
jgi:glycosyltransferase involved in cell wall biosynthesis